MFKNNAEEKKKFSENVIDVGNRFYYKENWRKITNSMLVLCR